MKLFSLIMCSGFASHLVGCAMHVIGHASQRVFSRTCKSFNIEDHVWKRRIHITSIEKHELFDPRWDITYVTNPS